MKKNQLAVHQVSNVLKDKYTRNSAYEVTKRISQEFKASKADGKNTIKVFGPDGCFILVPVKSNGKLTAYGRRLRDGFLNNYKEMI